MTSIPRGRSITRTTALPALVLVLALAAIGAITLLQERSDSSDDAQLKLATIRVELNRLQTAPFGAQASTGGSPLRAATLMRTGKQRIAGTLGELRRKSPPPALSRLSAPLRANYAALDRIYVLGATGVGYEAEADRLATAAGGHAAAVSAQLAAGSRKYDRRASRSQAQATAGTVAVVLLLLAAFGVVYRRSVRARSTAEGLVQENQRLLAVSREEAIRDSLTGLRNRRDAFDIGCSYGITRLPTEAATVAEALRLADQRMYEHKSGRSSAGRQSTDVLLKVLSERSVDLQEHITGVARLAEMTAERLGLPRHEVKRIALAAELHDVGKTAIPDTILHKPGKLDPEEWEFMRRHTLIGERIVRAAPALAHTADLVRSSHERFDGDGYPDGLEGSAIPLGASIISVCDAFDAMVSERPYRHAMPVTDAIAELRRCSGTQFRPEVVELFCELAVELEPVG